MIRSLLILSFTVFVIGLGQQPGLGQESTATKDTKPAVEQTSEPTITRLESGAQQQIAEAQRQAIEARSVAEAANAKYDAAQQRVISAIFRVMAEMQLSPKEWQAKQDDEGNVYFKRIEARTDAPTESKPPSASAPPPRPTPKRP